MQVSKTVTHRYTSVRYCTWVHHLLCVAGCDSVSKIAPGDVLPLDRLRSRNY